VLQASIGASTSQWFFQAGAIFVVGLYRGTIRAFAVYRMAPLPLRAGIVVDDLWTDGRPGCNRAGLAIGEYLEGLARRQRLPIGGSVVVWNERMRTALRHRGYHEVSVMMVRVFSEEDDE
jgi:hypothetical protein